MATARRRLDAELVRRGLAGSRTEAQAAIRAGLVTVDGGPALKAATQVHAGQAVAVAAAARRYVSRGGEKLAHGLERFAIDVTARRCLDVGASTGGFTDCLLQHDAASVLAYDVGYGQLHWSLRRDPRVEVFERTNIRDVTPADIPHPPPDLIVCDVSFIALRTVLPVLRHLGDPEAEALVLVKPQFEAGRDDVGRGGVVRDPNIWQQVLTDVAASAAAQGWDGFDATASPLTGPAGNVEFLAHLRAGPGPDSSRAVAVAVDEGEAIRAGVAPQDPHGGART